MNWGYRIALVLFGFIGMMAYFIYVALQQSNEMMDSSYYEKEKQFEQTLHAAANLDNEQAKVQLEQLNGDVHFTIPVKDPGDFPLVKMEFICFSDKGKDRSFSQRPDSTGKLMIPAKEFSKGQYQLRMQWTSLGKDYAIRESFYYTGL